MYICFTLFLWIFSLGVSSVPFLDLSLVNDTVERGGIFEVQANHFSPNLTSNSFLGIACGYLSDPVTYAPLTRWFGGNFNSMTPIQSLPSAYQERVKVRERTIMRIENTRFTDEGTTFFCTLSFLNQSVLAEIHKTVKLKSVYGKCKGISGFVDIKYTSDDL